MRVLFPLILLASFGCGADPLGPIFEQRLTHFGGCADVIFYAVDADDEVMVTFRAQGLVASAQEGGTETETVFQLPADGVDLILEQGSRISDATCDDVIRNGGPRVRRTWTAASGTATVRIRPDQGSSGGRGDLLLEGVVFTSDGEDAVALHRLEWLDVPVGWLPG